MVCRTLGAFALAALAAAALEVGCAPISSFGEGFDVQGHRGTRARRPENTLPSFAEAMCIGVTTVELDVGVSKDGVVVVRHGRGLHPEITRGPDGRFIPAERVLISALTLAELRRFDVGRVRPGSRYAMGFPDVVPIDGTRIPTLEETIALVDPSRSGVRLNIETKISPENPADTLPPDAFADAVIAVLRKTGALKYATLQSFDWRTLARAKAVAPEIPRVHLSHQAEANGALERRQTGAPPWFAGHDYDGSLPKLIASLEGAVWSPLYRDLDRESLREAQTLGLLVVPWTVNEPRDMDRLIEWGVDGLITDYPGRLHGVLRARGLPVPPAVAVEGAAGRSARCPPGGTAEVSN